MLGSEVLDTGRFSEITFASTQIDSAGSDRWNVAGRLTIRDRTRSVTFPVQRVNGAFRGAVSIKQRDFGIEPIRIAGGTVKVKDELRIEFAIVRQDAAPRHTGPESSVK